MTTLACNLEIMSSDSQVEHDGVIFKDQKIFRINDEIIGLAGETDAGYRFLEWCKKGKPQDVTEINGDMEALVLNKDGIFIYYNSLIPIPTNAEFYALGSGSDMALGAMHMGASPKEAVKIVCKACTHSGPPIKSLRL